MSVASNHPRCARQATSTQPRAKWPDVPGDQSCNSGAACSNHSPTFWSRKRLTGITTEIRDGTGGWTTVDSYKLKQSFPDPGDGTTPAMWLDSIQHTGGTGVSAVTLPAATFAATKLANRADGIDGAPAMVHNRISAVTTETGEIIGVQYKTECAAPVRLDPVVNTSLCYPVYWTMEGHSSPTLDWFHKYVVTEIDDQDPTGTIGPDGRTRTPPVVTTYTYLGGGGWHFDDNEIVKPQHRTYGQWRGFGRVQTRTGNGDPDPRTLSETIFYRGLDGDTQPGGGHRTATVGLSTAVPVPGAAGAVPDTNELAGSVRETVSFNGDGGPADHATVTDYWVSPPTARRARAGLPDLTASMTRTASTRTTTAITSSNAVSWRTTQTDTSYDTTTGLPVVVYDHGDITKADQARCTTTTYAPANVGANLVGLPAEVETDARPCGGSGVNGLTPPAGVSRPADVISDVRTYYDNPRFATTWPQPAPTVGDVSVTQQATDYTSGAFTYLTKTKSLYDGKGRPTQVTDANNNNTTTGYTDTAGLTTQVATSNPLKQTTTTTLDPTRGLTLTTLDPNNLQTDLRYDALGRLTGVWRPGRNRSDGANLVFSYQVSQSTPSTITTKTLNFGGSYNTSVAFYDAMTRPRQTQTSVPNTSIGRLVTDTFYDSHGWAVKVNNAYSDDSNPPTTTLVDMVGYDQRIPNQDLISYDGLGRKTVVVSNAKGVNQWQTAMVYGGDRTTVIPPRGATPTTAVVDALGRKTELDSYTTPPTIAGGQVTGSHTTIRYGYDHRGNPATITDDRGAIWTSVFNLLGQVVTKTDPDAGTSQLTYDNVGNVATTTDARATLSYSYDPLGRKTGIYDGPLSTSPMLAAWSYDTATPNGIGKPASATSYDNGYAYTTSASGGYDTFGNPLATTVSIPADPTNGVLSRDYTFTHVYDTRTGVPIQTRYPAAGGLPAETVSYGHDAYGDFTAVGGLGDYTDSSSYDQFGRVYTTKLGLGTDPTVTLKADYTYDEHTSRLTTATLYHRIQDAPDRRQDHLLLRSSRATHLDH